MKKTQTSGMILEQDTAQSLARVPVAFIGDWIVMLALGALGHRLHIPFLLKIGYWDVILLNVACSMFRGSQVTKWRFKFNG